MNAFFLPSKRGINFAKIRGFKVTDYSRHRRLATSRLGGYGSPLAWALGKGPTRGGRHLAGVTQRMGPVGRNRECKAK